MNLRKLITDMRRLGYGIADARARVCQDIVLKGIAESSLSRNVTIKGGVVMRSMSGDVRRATQDIDIDFIRYSLSEEAIDRFLDSINCIEGIRIERDGEIEDLNQQDYNGKRVFIKITDGLGYVIESKIDLGVHKHFEIEQEEYCFDIAFDEKGASLLINSKEQMFVEKLRSLLKFGSFSTRYKDIYDMYYHRNQMKIDGLDKCLSTYIFNDTGMRENSMQDIVRRVDLVFSDASYKQRVDSSDKRWLDDDIDEIFCGICNFLIMLAGDGQGEGL